MKIGYVSSSLSSRGGWARYAKGVVQAISRFADVIVLSRRDALNDAIEGVSVHRVLPHLDHSFRLAIQLRVSLQVVRYLRGCDVIHSLIEPFGPGAALGSMVLGSPFVITCHGTYAVPPTGYTVRAFSKRQMMKLMYRRVAIATTGSERTLRLITQLINLDECRIIPNGVDTSTFYRLQIENPKSPFLLTVGDVKPRKGVDVTIRALATLREDFPDIGYKIVGDTSSSRSFFEHVQTLVRSYGLESRVEFLGKISDAELRSLYNQCSMFILAAQTRHGTFEGFPMVFFEAGACGAPVIATTGFGSEYAVKHGYNGFLVEPENVELLAAAIRRLLLDDHLRVRMSENSLKFASEHAWERIAEQHLLKLYRDAAQQQCSAMPCQAPRGSA